MISASWFSGEIWRPSAYTFGVTLQESFVAPIDRNYTPKHRAWVDLKKSISCDPPLIPLILRAVFLRLIVHV